MQSWQPIGKHLLRIEEDLVFVVAQGEITGDEIIALCEQLLIVHKKYGWVFEIVDAKAAGSMGAQARRQNAAWHRHHRVDLEGVVFGANLLVRTIFSLVLNAFRMLGSDQVQMHFMATEAEARAWVEQRRERKRSAAVAR